MHALNVQGPRFNPQHHMAAPTLRRPSSSGPEKQHGIQALHLQEAASGSVPGTKCDPPSITGSDPRVQNQESTLVWPRPSLPKGQKCQAVLAPWPQHLTAGLAEYHGDLGALLGEFLLSPSKTDPERLKTEQRLHRTSGKTEG